MFDQNAQAPPCTGTSGGITVPRLAALIGAGLLIAGCGGNAATPGGGGDAGSAAGSVATRDHPQLGTVLTNSSGRALYFTDQEADGKVRCVEACLSFWSPMVTPDATAPAQVKDLGVIQRDGQNQLTYQGKPLYTFSQDTAEGQVTGDKVEDDFSGTHFVWHAVVLGGQPSGGDTQSPSETGGGYGY